MFAIRMHIEAGLDTDWIPSAIYEHLAQTYKLPLLAELLSTVTDQTLFLRSQEETQVYYLENLHGYGKAEVFQVRFKTSKDAREFTDVVLSVRNERVLEITLSFPSRGDRYCHAKVLGWLKEMMNPRDEPVTRFELNGFAESPMLRYIRETYLSAFVWTSEMGRYLHVSDEKHAVRKMNRGNA